MEQTGEENHSTSRVRENVLSSSNSFSRKSNWGFYANKISFVWSREVETETFPQQWNSDLP